MSTSYTDPYLQWMPIGHADGCTAEGWDVRAFERRGIPPGGDFSPRVTVQVALRAVCRTCGTSYELAADTGWVDQESGALDGPRIDTTKWAAYGHLARPRRVKDYWLHAHGERVNLDGGYLGYYLTRSRRPPTTPDEVLGLVWSHLNRRGNTKYTAGLAGVSEGGRQLYAARRAERDWDSPTAAARWLTVALADSPTAES